MKIKLNMNQKEVLSRLQQFTVSTASMVQTFMDHEEVEDGEVDAEDLMDLLVDVQDEARRVIKLTNSICWTPIEDLLENS